MSDLKRQGQIRALREQGLGVREIARQVGTSPSTVSRVLQLEPNRQRFAELVQRIESLERKLETTEHELRLCQQCLHIVARFAYQAGAQYRQNLLEVLQQWPGEYFRRLKIEGKL